MKKTISQLNNNHNGFTQTPNVWVSGFTLMEVMVSVSIFAIIITIGIGSLLTIYSTLQKTRADQQTMDSLSYVLDTMTRRVRTGSEYQSDGQSITFIDQDQMSTGTPITVTYSMQTDQNGIKRLYVTETDGGQYDITPENMVIDTFNVNLTGGATGIDGGQPMVEFQIQGTIKNGKQITPLAIQTVVSQRPFEGDGTVPVTIRTGNPDSGSFSSGSGSGIRTPRTESADEAAAREAKANAAAEASASASGTANALNNPR